MTSEGGVESNAWVVVEAEDPSQSRRAESRAELDGD